MTENHLLGPGLVDSAEMSGDYLIDSRKTYPDADLENRMPLLSGEIRVDLPGEGWMDPSVEDRTNAADMTADLLAGSGQAEVDTGSGATPLRQLDPWLSKHKVLPF
jgi:hypothetical protein